MRPRSAIAYNEIRRLWIVLTTPNTPTTGRNGVYATKPAHAEATTSETRQESHPAAAVLVKCRAFSHPMAFDGTACQRRATSRFRRRRDGVWARAAAASSACWPPWCSSGTSTSAAAARTSTSPASRLLFCRAATAVGYPSRPCRRPGRCAEQRHIVIRYPQSMARHAAARPPGRLVKLCWTSATGSSKSTCSYWSRA